MYNNSVSVLGASAVGGAGALAFTGANVVWLALGAFALIAAGIAILRIVPRREL
jgi:hypothetical protein